MLMKNRLGNVAEINSYQKLASGVLQKSIGY